MIFFESLEEADSEEGLGKTWKDLTLGQIIISRKLTTKTSPSEKTRIEHFQNIEKLGNPGRRNFLWILEKNKTPPEAKFFEKQ